MKKLSLCILLTLAWQISAQDTSPAIPEAPESDPTDQPAPSEPVAAAEQLPSVFERYPRAIGFSSGDLTGSGFVYRQWAGEWGFHLSGMAIFNPNNTTTFANWDYVYHSAGSALLKTLFRGEPSSWFYSQLYVMGHLAYQGRQARLHGWFNNTPDEILPYNGTLNTGVGIGMELGLFQHLSWVLEVSERARIPVINGTGTEKLEIGPQFQVSALYRF